MAASRVFVPSTIIRDVSDPTPNAIAATGPMADPNFIMRQREADAQGLQGTLFPTEELIVPESVRSIKKAVSAIHAVPVKPEHAQTLNSRRLFDACILIAQSECRGKETELVRRLKEDRISPMFEIRISHLAELAGIKGKNFQRVYEELDQLWEMSLNWNVVGEDASIEWEMRSHFFSTLGYGRNYKKGMVRFAFDPEVLALLLEPTIWARFSMLDNDRMDTSASYALFQNTWRYVGTQNKVTAAFPTHVWVNLLVGKSRYVTELPDGQKKVSYGDFKRRVLDPAIQRVNDCAALAYTLELKEYKSGNRVIKLQFKFIPKLQRQLAIPLTWPQDMVALLEQIGFGRQEIDDLSQAYSLTEVADAITRLQAAEKRMREKGRAITSRRAYFEGILRKITSSPEGEPIDDAQLEAEVQATVAKKEAEDRMAKLKEAFQLHQRERFADWFAGLADQQREELATALQNSPTLDAGKRMLVKNGVTLTGYSGQSVLRQWLATERPELLEAALPNPEDKSFDNWMAWRLDR